MVGKVSFDGVDVLYHHRSYDFVGSVIKNVELQVSCLCYLENLSQRLRAASVIPASLRD